MPRTRKRTKPAERYSRQVENRNFLSPTGFRFILKRSPEAAFFCNQANIPALDLGTTVQPNYLRDIPVPGDKIEFGDLTIRFLVDEDLTNYMELQNWIRGLGFPETRKNFSDLRMRVQIMASFLQKMVTISIPMLHFRYLVTILSLSFK